MAASQSYSELRSSRNGEVTEFSLPEMGPSVFYNGRKEEILHDSTLRTILRIHKKLDLSPPTTSIPILPRDISPFPSVQSKISAATGGGAWTGKICSSVIFGNCNENGPEPESSVLIPLPRRLPLRHSDGDHAVAVD